MIVREIKDDPDEVLATFDWFNDFQDTRSWCLGQKLDDIVLLLDKGNKKFWDRKWKGGGR